MNAIARNLLASQSASPLHSVQTLAEQLAAADAQIDALQSRRAALYKAAKGHRVSEGPIARNGAGRAPAGRWRARLEAWKAIDDDAGILPVPKHAGARVLV